MMKVIAAIAVLIVVTGCSMKVEFGYHGETGRDDRTQTIAKR